MALLLLRAQIPLDTRPHGIVSRIVLDGVHPAGDYLKYVLEVLAAALAAVLALAWLERRSTALPALAAAAPAGPRGSALARGWVVVLAACALVGLVNENLPEQLGYTLADPFHEGEYLGFLPAFRQLGEPFTRAIVIHGFALDVFPALFASWMGWGIAGARLATTVLDVLAHVAAGWVLWEAVRSAGRPVRLPLFVAFAVAYAVTYRLAWDLSRKDFVFFAQLGLLLWTARRAHAGKPALAGAVAWGCTLPLAFLYSYDRALYMVGVALPFLALGVLLARREMVRVAAGAIGGALLGAAVLWAGVGTVGVRSLLAQLAFWGETGRYVWSVPILDPAWPESLRGPTWVAVLVLVYAWGAQGLAGGLLARAAWRQGLAGAWRAHHALVALLGGSLLYMRVALDRSDLGHVQNGAFPSLLLLGALFLPALQARLDAGPWRPGNGWGWAAAAVVVLAVLPARSLRTPGMFDPVAAASRLARLPASVAAPDADVVPAEYLEGARWLRQAAPADRCFFTLTSEGLWYYLLDRPSCSPYHQLLYARTRTADAQVAAELEGARPTFVLVSNHFWTNRLDGVTPFNSSPLVSRRVLAGYRPAHRVGGHWFWRRAARPWTMRADAPAGTLDAVPARATQRFDAGVGGALRLAVSDPATAAVLVLRDADGVAISAAPLAVGARRWTAEVPTASLPPGRTRVRAWLADGRTGTLHPLGPAFELAVEPGRMTIPFRLGR